MPLLVAPVAFQRLVDPDGEVAMARAAAAAGTIMCLSTIATSRPTRDRRRGAAGAALVPALLLPRPRRHPGADRRGGRVRLRGDRADRRRAARGPARARPAHRLRGPAGRHAPRRSPPRSAPSGRSASQEVFALVDPSLDWDDLERSPRSAALPVARQGRSRPARTRALAVEHGAAGVVVSNHGGRQLDGVPATLDILPEVVEAVDGRCEVLIDGGIRRGTDVAHRAGARRPGGARRPARRSGGSRSAARQGRARRARAAARGDRAGAGAARLPVARTGRRAAEHVRARGLYSHEARWLSGIHARRRCAASTAPGRCSPPPTATSARRSTTRSALVALYALGLTPVTFMIAGLIFAFTAATYVEATVLYPEAGGSSSFARHAFNEFASLPRRLGADAHLHRHGRDLGLLRPALPGRLLGAARAAARATSSSGSAWSPLLALLNIKGTEESARLNLVLAVADLLTQVVLVVIGLALVFDPDLLVNQVDLGTAPTLGRLRARDRGRDGRLHRDRDDLEHGRGGARRRARTIPRGTGLVVLAVVGLYALLPAIALSAMPVTAGRRRRVHDRARRRPSPTTRCSGSSRTSASAPGSPTCCAVYVGILAAVILLIATNAALIGLSRLTFSMGQHRQLPELLRAGPPDASRRPTSRSSSSRASRRS